LEYQIIQRAVRSTPIAGSVITQRLVNFLKDPNRSKATLVKENECYIAYDPQSIVFTYERAKLDPRFLISTKEQEPTLLPSTLFGLPVHLRPTNLTNLLDRANETNCTVPLDPHSLFIGPEILFQPSLSFDKEISSSANLAETIFQSILSCPEDLWSDLFGNIVLSGGTAKLPGLTERLRVELENLLLKLEPSHHHHLLLTVKVSKVMDPLLGAYLGGAEVSARDDLVAQNFISSAGYEEEGRRINQKMGHFSPHL
jgi:hypothetical protein